MTNDVFDEDLMRELGLDPEDIANVKVPPPPQKKPVPPAPQAQAQTPQRPAAPRPQPQAPQQAEESSITERQAVPAAPQPSARPTVPADPKAHAERIAQGIPVHLAAVLAKKSIPLKEAIELSVGEVVDFKKSPDEPIDLVANGKLVAKAELVMIDGKIGARIVKLVR